MSIYEIINLLKRRKEACESALRDLYNADSVCIEDSEVIRLEEQIDTYNDLLNEIGCFN